MEKLIEEIEKKLSKTYSKLKKTKGSRNIQTGVYYWKWVSDGYGGRISVMKFSDKRFLFWNFSSYSRVLRDIDASSSIKKILEEEGIEEIMNILREAYSWISVHSKRSKVSLEEFNFQWEILMNEFSYLKEA